MKLRNRFFPANYTVTKNTSITVNALELEDWLKDEIVTSTYIQAIEDATEALDKIEQEYESGDLNPMLVFDALQSLKQIKE